MLRDKLRVHEKDERFEDLECQVGTCKFCGQMKNIYPLLPPWTQEEVDECASETCGCPQSLTYANRKERLEIAAEIIQSKFGESTPGDDDYIDNSDEVCRMLNGIAWSLVHGQIRKALIRITAKVKCDMSLVPKTGMIKIKRTITHEDTEET